MCSNCSTLYISIVFTTSSLSNLITPARKILVISALHKSYTYGAWEYIWMQYNYFPHSIGSLSLHIIFWMYIRKAIIRLRHVPCHIMKYGLHFSSCFCEYIHETAFDREDTKYSHKLNRRTIFGFNIASEKHHHISIQIMLNDLAHYVMKLERGRNEPNSLIHITIYSYH